MGKAIDLGKTSATGSFQLFVGKIISTVILALGTIIVGIYIAPEDYGVYTTALVPATTLYLFLDWGLGYALTRYCATYRAAGKEGELRNIILSGLAFMVVSGMILALICLSTANFIAATVFGRPESAFLIALASISIISTGLLLCANSIFTGFERMKLMTVTLILSGATNGLLSPLLVYFGLGAFGAMIGYTVGSATSATAAVLLLYFVVFRKLPMANPIKGRVFQTLRPLLRYGIPISLGGMLAGLIPQIYNFLMASYVDLVMIANFRIASNFLVVITFFLYPIQTVLFPAFSKIDASTDKKLLETLYSTSVKYSSLFLTPITMALIVLSNPIINSIYVNKYPLAPLYLALYVSGYLSALLGNVINNRFLLGVGETKFLMKLHIFQFCLGVPLAFLLIPPFGILGLISLILFEGVPTMFVGLYWTWKKYGVRPDLPNSAKIFLASAMAGATTYIFQSFFAATPWISLFLGAGLFLVTYLVSAPVIGAIDQTDINSLRIMFSGLGPVSNVLKALLAIIEKPLRIKHARPQGQKPDNLDAQ